MPHGYVIEVFMEGMVFGAWNLCFGVVNLSWDGVLHCAIISGFGFSFLFILLHIAFRLCYLVLRMLHFLLLVY
jgi:hypothetical protein